MSLPVVNVTRLVDAGGEASRFFFFVDHSANNDEGSPSIARLELPRRRGDFFAVDQSEKRDSNFWPTCLDEKSKGVSSMASRGCALGVAFGF